MYRFHNICMKVLFDKYYNQTSNNFEKLLDLKGIENTFAITI